jgi:hypothetical protein
VDTETLDRIYLEWSQFTAARTAREIEMGEALDALLEVVGDMISDGAGALNPGLLELARKAIARAAKARFQ